MLQLLIRLPLPLMLRLPLMRLKQVLPRAKN